MATAAQDIQDDYAEHMHDYRQFVRIVQIVVAGVATVLLLLAFFLVGSRGGNQGRPSVAPTVFGATLR